MRNPKEDREENPYTREGREEPGGSIGAPVFRKLPLHLYPPSPICIELFYLDNSSHVTSLDAPTVCAYHACFFSYKIMLRKHANSIL